MKHATRLLGSTTLTALAGAVLFAAAAVAQPTPSPNPAAQPSSAPPGSESVPYGANQPMNQATEPQSGSTTNSGSATNSMNSTMSASAGKPLSQVKNARTTLATASVQDSSGQSVGQVATVHTTKRGTPTTIDITLTGGNGQAKTVAVKADSLRYDDSSNTLKTDLTSSELNALPSASGT